MGNKIQNTQDKQTVVNFNYWDIQGDQTYPHIYDLKKLYSPPYWFEPTSL